MLGNIMASRVSLKDVEHDLLSGLPVLIYDGDSREGETDTVFYAGKADWGDDKHAEEGGRRSDMLRHWEGGGGQTRREVYD